MWRSSSPRTSYVLKKHEGVDICCFVDWESLKSQMTRHGRSGGSRSQSGSTQRKNDSVAVSTFIQLDKKFKSTERFLVKWIIYLTGVVKNIVSNFKKIILYFRNTQFFVQALHSTRSLLWIIFFFFILSFIVGPIGCRPYSGFSVSSSTLVFFFFSCPH